MIDQLTHIFDSASLLLPEAIVTAALLITIVLGLTLKTNQHLILKSLALITYGVSIFMIIHHLPTTPTVLFGNMLRIDSFSSYFKILFLTGGILGVWISRPPKENTSPEYFLLFHAVILGSCLLASSMNFIMVLLSLEMISLSSYLLAGFGFDRKVLKAV